MCHPVQMRALRKVDRAVDQHHCAAPRERHEDFHDRQVEADRGHGGHTAQIALREDPVGLGQHRRAAAVPDRHSLGPARGTRGVDHVCGVGRGRGGGRLGCAGTQLRSTGSTEHQHLGADRAAVRRGGRGQDQTSAAVLLHEAQPFPRVLGIERQVAGARAEGRENSDEQVRRTLDTDTHRYPRPRTFRHQLFGQQRRSPVKLSVGHHPRVVVDRRRIRTQGGVLQQPPVQRSRTGRHSSIPSCPDSAVTRRSSKSGLPTD